MKTMIDRILDTYDSEGEIEKILNEIGYEYKQSHNRGYLEQSFSFYDLTYIILKFLEHIKEIDDNTESIPL